VNKEFARAYKQLNPKQKQAVDQIDGPVLVIAGPGTGKTQLLSTRVGYILNQTDALPQNILCLSFTESGVDAMRERLSSFLGQAAYDVALSTYHAFGSDLLRRYPEYAGSYDFEPVDELGADSLVREILAAASYANPLKSSGTYASDLRTFMGECKRALLTPKDVQAIARDNQAFITKASEVISTTLSSFIRIDKNSLALFERLRAKLEVLPTKANRKVAGLKQTCLEELSEALERASESGKTSAITAWKNDWLAKDGSGQFILAGEGTNQKIAAAGEIYSLYQELLAKRKLYDYDDMILRAISALQTHPDLKFSLAEQYQYILLDEFQDTNPAQLKIVELLTDNPVNEGRPNIMAVGDDDQAIYAFQGANHANMYSFARMYRDVRVISLRQNYRSHHEILDVAYILSSQIKERLHEQFRGISKILKAASASLPERATVAHYEFISDAAQYAWVANQAKELVAKGRIAPEEIAILTPKHRYLIPVLPFLAEKGLAVRYEKRENVLDKPVVHVLEQMSRLVLALAVRDQPTADALWPEVLSYDFWGLSTAQIWDVSWEADKSRVSWTETLLKDSKTKNIVEFFLRLKDLLPLTTLEQQLDLLVGVSEADVKDYKLPQRSPFFEYYFGSKQKDTVYLELLSDLSVLRGRLRAWRREEVKPFNLADFISFIDSHRAAELNILNSSPHYEARSAINVMTAYQAKGREFKVVFVLAAQDEVWGGASRNASSNISLPPNLRFIRYRGASDDERLRLLYVAITRAKTHLYLTSYAATLDGRRTSPLRYLAGQEALRAIAPQPFKQPLLASDLQNYWHLRHIPPLKPKLEDLLQPTLGSYQLSPTHLNQFTDVINGGPERFFLNTILRFPKAQSPSAQYGTVIHESLKWLHDVSARNAKSPTAKQVLAFFEERLRLQRLANLDYELFLERGQEALKAYIDQASTNINASDILEHNFRNEGAFAGEARLTGKIDKLVIDKKAKLITVVDFKTGRSYDKWQNAVVKLHKYRQQLLMYKLLIEGSHTFAGYRVEKGVLQFVEPDGRGEIVELELQFDNDELEKIKQLTQAVWRRIQNLDFPDTDTYPPTIAGIKAFEQDLIK